MTCIDKKNCREYFINISWKVTHTELETKQQKKMYICTCVIKVVTLELELNVLKLATFIKWLKACLPQNVLRELEQKKPQLDDLVRNHWVIIVHVHLRLITWHGGSSHWVHWQWEFKKVEKSGWNCHKISGLALNSNFQVRTADSLRESPIKQQIPAKGIFDNYNNASLMKMVTLTWLAPKLELKSSNSLPITSF